MDQMLILYNHNYTLFYELLYFFFKSRQTYLLELQSVMMQNPLNAAQVSLSQSLSYSYSYVISKCLFSISRFYFPLFKCVTSVVSQWLCLCVDAVTTNNSVQHVTRGGISIQNAKIMIVRNYRYCIIMITRNNRCQYCVSLLNTILFWFDEEQELVITWITFIDLFSDVQFRPEIR